MLDLARKKLIGLLDVLRPAIRSGIPVVGVEPSCMSVFRDEMPDLLAGDADAERLAMQTKTLCELLVEPPGWRPPKFEGKALLQLHCHSKSVLNAEAERKVLSAMGLELEQPAVGCCGHAGAFGYETQHYPVSMEIAEQALLPALRKLEPDPLVISDGFSCRHQIRDGVGRWAFHPAEIIAAALQHTSGRAETLQHEPPAKVAARDARTLAVAAAQSSREVSWCPSSSVSTVAKPSHPYGLCRQTLRRAITNGCIGATAGARWGVAERLKRADNRLAVMAGQTH
jgi:hypothetical protein